MTTAKTVRRKLAPKLKPSMVPGDITIYARVPPSLSTALDVLTKKLSAEFGYANRSHAMRQALLAGFKVLGIPVKL
jgi:hypothetical protein